MGPAAKHSTITSEISLVKAQNSSNQIKSIEFQGSLMVFAGRTSCYVVLNTSRCAAIRWYAKVKTPKTFALLLRSQSEGSQSTELANARNLPKISWHFAKCRNWQRLILPDAYRMQGQRWSLSFPGASSLSMDSVSRIAP